MNWILRVTGAFLLFALAFVLFGYVTMNLWNWIMPYLFHLPTVTFGMALGLVVLSKILLGGIRVKTAGPFGPRRFWKAKWESMTEEERENFKSDFAKRCNSKWGRGGIQVEKD